MEIVRRSLEPDALFLLHTIGRATSAVRTDAWIHGYIFPNGQLPSAKQIIEAAEGVLLLEDWDNFPQDHDRTLMCWHENFVAGWDELRGGYDERFYRMWTCYLLICAGGFRARRNLLWQIVFSAEGCRDGYTPENIR